MKVDENFDEPDAGGDGRGPRGGDALVDEVAARLEEDIVFGRFHPRERLVEEELTRQLGVKRHVVRRVLIEMERLGLVERIRNRGAVVRFYQAKEVEDINAVRELIESHAAALIPLPLKPEAVEELRRLQKEHADAAEAGDRRGVFRRNIKFHEALFAHCGNSALIEAIKSFAQKSHAYRSIFVNDAEYVRWAARAHLEMVRAIESADRETLVRLCREHLAPAKNHYIETWRSRMG